MDRPGKHTVIFQPSGRRGLVAEGVSLRCDRVGLGRGRRPDGRWRRCGRHRRRRVSMEEGFQREFVDAIHFPPPAECQGGK